MFFDIIDSGDTLRINLERVVSLRFKASGPAVLTLEGGEKAIMVNKSEDVARLRVATEPK